MTLSPFHLAIPVHDLTLAEDFYAGLLGCYRGRSSDHWIDYNFFGHQLVCHLDVGYAFPEVINLVDGHHVPVPHFGVVLTLLEWHSLRLRLQSANTRFVIEPYVRFEGQAGEQATMFLQDQSGNALEFKAFKNIEAELFKT